MNIASRKRYSVTVLALLLGLCFHDRSAMAAGQVRGGQLALTRAEYEDRAKAIWIAQMIGQLTGLNFEHKEASVLKDTPLLHAKGFAEPDDDYYYEMVAIRGFEKYGIHMTVEQLGQQWLENSAGSWGSSEQALMLLKRGIKAPDTGNPRYNRLWWTIGPQFSSDVYGTLAPGMPNVAAAMARKYGHVNGYAEGVDGAVFVSGMISLGFVETDTKQTVRKAAQLISPLSPYRQCLDMIIAMADAGKQPEEIFRAVNERWGIEYPATNNAVVNGGIVAASVWFGGGDFLKTENLAFDAADFADTDCNAANAASVVAAMHGMSALPAQLVASFNDTVRGDIMGSVALTPPVDESISALGKRTASIGQKILLAHGARLAGDTLMIKTEEPVTQAPELFTLADLSRMWNPDWTLERAGFGGTTGGLKGLRGSTYLTGETLVVFPRDEVRGALLRRSVALSNKPSLDFDAGVDPHRAWQLVIFVNNDKVLDQLIDAKASNDGGTLERQWQHIQLDLSKYRSQSVVIRLYDLILVPGHEAGNSYWKNLRMQ